MNIFATGISDNVLFVVKNVTISPKKIIKVFNTPMYPGTTLDVMQIPGISEEDIRTSLIKGDLKNKLKTGQLQVVSSTVAFPESDTAFIKELGIMGLSNNIINPDVIADISTQGDGLPDGTVKFTSPPRAAMWTLNKNIDSSKADGIKYIAARGGGVWIRNMANGSPGANLQDTWYVNFDTGNNNADGLTPSTAVKNVDEIQARWGNQIIDGYFTPSVFIHISGNDSKPHTFSPCMSNFVLIYFKGTRINTPGLSGTLTTYQNWNGNTKTQCEFSWSSLIGTWTPGQFLSLPSLGNVSVVVGRDIGSKTAVSCDAVDLDNIASVDGAAVTFQGYSFNKLNGKISLSPSGEGTLIFQDIQLGDPDNIDLHWVNITGTNGGGGQVLFIGCSIYGVDNYNDTLAAAVGCYIVGWRNYGRDLMLGNIHDSVGGAIYRVHEQGFSDIISNVLLLGVPSIDPSGALLIESNCSCYNAFQGWLVKGEIEIDGSFWVKNANINGSVLQVTAGAKVTYTDAAKIGSTGTSPTNRYVVPGASSNTLPLVSPNSLCGIIKLI